MIKFIVLVCYMLKVDDSSLFIIKFVVKIRIRLYNYIAYNKYVTKKEMSWFFWQREKRKNPKGC